MKRLLFAAALLIASPAHATCYVNWMAMTQPVKSDVLQMEGNAVSDAVTVADAGTSAVAPQGAQYASLFCTVASTVEANIISLRSGGEPHALYSAKEMAVPAGISVQIPNIVVGKTTITVNDI